MAVPVAVIKWEPLVIRKMNELGYLKKFNIKLALAIIWQESTGNEYAWNPEPRYRWFMDVKKRKPFREVSEPEIAAEYPPQDFPCLAGDPDQEWWGQQASWGLMQIMGSAARERGFMGGYLPQLVEPEINVEFGLKHLWVYAYQGGARTTESALLRWNGGGDGEYANKVIKKLTEIERG